MPPKPVQDKQGTTVPNDVANEPKKRKNRTSKQQRYLKALGVVRPPTDFQLWCEATKPTLLRDIETGEPPEERRTAYTASLNDTGRCNINVYRSKLWRPASDGGFGVVSANERAHWRAEYQKVRAEWQARKTAALSEYPKRPDSPYFLFYRQFYERYIEEHPDASLETVAKEASVVWKEKGKSEEFSHYHTQSARLQDEYEKKKQAFDRKMAALENKKEEENSEPAQTASAKAMHAAEQGAKTALTESASAFMDSGSAEDADGDPPRKRIRTVHWNALNTECE